jgi:hypothetical protein
MKGKISDVCDIHFVDRDKVDKARKALSPDKEATSLAEMFRDLGIPRA